MTESVPQNIVDLCTACIASVKATIGFDLDFEPETLPLLDHYVRKELRGTKVEVSDLAAPMCGTYFGEVIRRRFEGFRWFAPAEESGRFRLEFERALFAVHPVTVAAEVLLERSVTEWSSWLTLDPARKQDLLDSLEFFGKVRHEDYYSFTLRFEAVEHLVAVLVRLEDGKKPKHFATAQYDELIGPS